MRKTAIGLLVMVFLAIIISMGCGRGGPKNGFRYKTGMGFDFPAGWSELSEREWREMKLGDNQTLITVMDQTRSAAFSIIPVQMEYISSDTFKFPGKSPDPSAVAMVESIHQAAPGRYGEYSLWEKGETTFAGVPMAEIVFEGKRPGKALRWYRMLVFSTGGFDKTVIMFMFTTPIDEDEAFEGAFESIESTWHWE